MEGEGEGDRRREKERDKKAFLPLRLDVGLAAAPMPC
jgi:hypothetical protein